MKELVYRVVSEALENGALTVDEIREVVEDVIESYEQENGDELDYAVHELEKSGDKAGAQYMRRKGI